MKEAKTGRSPAHRPDHQPPQGPLPHPSDSGGMIATKIVAHSGPLPAPEVLEHYDRIETGLAGRIVAMAESEQEHRHRMDSELVELQRLDIGSYYRESRRGQYFALGTVAIVGFVAFFLAYLGHPASAATLMGATLVGLVYVFIKGRQAEAPEKDAE